MNDHPRQPITPELRDWIASQSAAGHAPPVVLEAMRASGWDDASALAALEATLGPVDAARASRRASGAGTAPGIAAGAAAGAGARDDLPSGPASVSVPEPLPDGPVASLRTTDRDVTVLASLRHPRVVVFGGLLDETECDVLIALARSRLARSETVQTETGASEVNAARTSEGMFFERGEHPVVARLESRIAELLHWPVDHGEGLQILRYGEHAEYKPHYDYFDPGQPGTPAILTRGGQRVASLVCYLNTPTRGGATIFPDVGLDVAPVRGNAVFFSYDRPHPSTRTLHGGAPVETGEKWVATKWLREGVFV